MAARRAPTPRLVSAPRPVLSPLEAVVRLVAGLAKDLALRELGKPPLLTPRPDPMVNLLLRIEMMDMQIIDRTAVRARLAGEELSSPPGNPVALILPLRFPRRERHQLAARPHG